MQNASLMKRYGAGCYELLSLIAIWLFCTFLFELLFSQTNIEYKRVLLQAVLWTVTGLYLVTCWVKTGQTVATQAWKVKLVNTDGNVLNVQQALLRYGLSSLSFLLLGLGFLWPFIDRDRLFLHDRLLKTRLINNIENV